MLVTETFMKVSNLIPEDDFDDSLQSDEERSRDLSVTIVGVEVPSKFFMSCL